MTCTFPWHLTSSLWVHPNCTMFILLYTLTFATICNDVFYALYPHSNMLYSGVQFGNTSFSHAQAAALSNVNKHTLPWTVMYIFTSINRYHYRFLYLRKISQEFFSTKTSRSIFFIIDNIICSKQTNSSIIWCPFRLRATFCNLHCW